MDELEAVTAEDWHPQDLILVAQALTHFGDCEHVSEARATRAYAILYRLIDTADIQFQHTDFSDYEHLSDMADTALTEWLKSQADDSWGDDLIDN